jgi:hypothetical protein
MIITLTGYGGAISKMNENLFKFIVLNGVCLVGSDLKGIWLSVYLDF